MLLNEIERQAKSSLGWHYIQEQCSSGPDWIGTLIERVIETASPWWRMRRAFKEMDKQYSAGANLGVLSAQATATRKGTRTQPELVLERLFMTLGEAARAKGVGVLVTLDEAHVMEPSVLATIGKTMQLVSRRRGMPVAVTLAGLPALQRNFRGGGTYLERLEVAELGHLDVTATQLALIKPAADRSVAFEDPAMQRLVEASAGYPYLVQLLGYEAWIAADGASPITDAHARVAVKRLMRACQRSIGHAGMPCPSATRPTWQRSPPSAPGPCPSEGVARTLGATNKSLSPRRQSLVEQRLIQAVRFGEVELTTPGMRTWILRTTGRRSCRIQSLICVTGCRAIIADQGLLHYLECRQNAGSWAAAIMGNRRAMGVDKCRFVGCQRRNQTGRGCRTSSAWRRSAMSSSGMLISQARACPRRSMRWSTTLT